MDQLHFLRQQILSNARFLLATGNLPKCKPGMNADSLETVLVSYSCHVENCEDPDCEHSDCVTTALHGLYGLLLVSMDAVQGTTTIISETGACDDLVQAFQFMLDAMAVDPDTLRCIKAVKKEQDQDSPDEYSDKEDSDLDFSGKPPPHKKEPVKVVYGRKEFSSASDGSAKRVKRESVDAEDSEVMAGFLHHQAKPTVHWGSDVCESFHSAEDSEPEPWSTSGVQQKRAPEVKKEPGLKPGPSATQVIVKDTEASNTGKKQKKKKNRKRKAGQVGVFNAPDETGSFGGGNDKGGSKRARKTGF